MMEKFNTKIYVFSDEIGCGKTTILKKWSQNKNKVVGFLSPKINGKRYFENLTTGEQRLIEVENSSLKIGKYAFDPDVFNWAEQEIIQSLESDSDWLIIDEIGPLEIRKNQGFHHLILKIISASSTIKPKILFVVRNQMLQEFISKYTFQQLKILPRKYFLDENQDPNLLGVALCGGESKRMQTDKALLKYNDKEQWKNIAELLQPFAEEVVISINENQWNNWAIKETENFLVDLEKFQNHGPLSGILSVIEKNPDKALMILATDFPLLKMEHLVQLNNARNSSYEAVCFEKDGFLQPLVSIIESSAISKLLEFCAGNQFSLRRFLEEIKTKKIVVEEKDFLKNINTKEDYIKHCND